MFKPLDLIGRNRPVDRPLQYSRVSEIDLLRFLAAVMVVVFHYAFRGYAADSLSIMPYPRLAPVAKYGYLGVELFFMISGFVILMTAASGSARKFVISRVVRLYPAFWVCCTMTFMFILALGAPRYSASVRRYLINMTMLSDFVSVEPIDGAYWSLFIEIQFYLLVLLILLLRQIRRVESVMFLWLSASILLELFPLSTLRDILIADYSAYFIAGAACYLIWAQGISVARVVLLAVAWGLALFRAIHELPLLERHFHVIFDAYVVAAMLTLFFVVMVLVSLRRTGALGAIDWQPVGALTYPLYLLHQIIGFIIFNRYYPMLNADVLFYGTIGFMLALAYSVHAFVEKPFSPRLKTILNVLADRLSASASKFRT